MNKHKIIVLGPDPRQEYLAQYLTHLGHQVSYQANPDAKSLPFNNASCLVLPMFPSARRILNSTDYCGPNALLCAGLPSQEFTCAATEHGFSVYDYMSDKKVAVQNAVATAEGALIEAMRLSKQTLHGSHCLIIGFGTCGEVLAQKCKALNAKVFLLEKDALRQVHGLAQGFSLQSPDVPLHEFSYIFNTVPSPVLTPSQIDTLTLDCVIIDIASSPGGTDFEYCLQKNILAKLCPSLPALYAPKTAGEILAIAIHKRLLQHPLS